MSNEEKKILTDIYRALNQLTVQGEQNLSIVLGCITAIRKLTSDKEAVHVDTNN